MCTDRPVDDDEDKDVTAEDSELMEDGVPIPDSESDMSNDEDDSL